LVNILKAAGPAFAEQADRLKADLKRGSVVASDETGLRVGKKNTWLWVFHDGPTALFLANQGRAKTVVEGSWATGGPTIGSPTDTSARWAGRPWDTSSACPPDPRPRYQMEAGDTIIAPAFLGPAQTPPAPSAGDETR